MRGSVVVPGDDNSLNEAISRQYIARLMGMSPAFCNARYRGVADYVSWPSGLCQNKSKVP